MTTHGLGFARAAALSMLLAMLLFGQARATDPSDRTFHFDIPAGALSQALRSFGQTAGEQIIFTEDLVSGISFKGLKGDFPADTVLKKLLEGTGLAAERSPTGVLMIRRAPPVSTNGSSIPSDAVAHDQQKEGKKGSSGAFLTPQAAPGQNQVSPTVEPPGTLPQEENRKAQIEEVVVTGTYLHNSTPISPILTLTQAELVDQGYARLDQALDQIPQNFRGAVAEDSNPITAAGNGASNNYSYSSGVNLRGLGPGATLVLLNGERVAPTAYGQSVDISQIPLSVIDRVELLTDGASAIYGSDAIGGVVNIVTKTDYSGFTMGARSSASEGKAPNYGGSATYGANWDAGNAVLSADYDQRNPLFARNRSFTATLPDPTMLLPQQETLSLYGAARQRFADDSEFSSTLLGSRREYEVSDVFNGVVIDDRGQAKQLNASIQYQRRLSPHWLSAIIGQYSVERDTDVESDPPQIFTRGVTYDVPSLEVRADGEVITTRAGAVRLAIGGLAREESFEWENGTVAGGVVQPQPTVELSRHIDSAYGELQIPVFSPENGVALFRQLTLDAAVRYDHYSDFGGSANPKYSLLWAPLDSLSMHASYAASFRAPTLFDLNPNGSSGYVWDATDPSSPGGTRTTFLIDGTNPDLMAEKADTYSMGLSWSRPENPAVSADLSYFSIAYRQKIDHLLDEGFFDNVITNASQLGPFVNLNPTLSEVNAALTAPGRTIINFTGNPYTPASILAIANIGFVNVGVSHVSGLDGSARYKVESPAGRFSVDVSGSYFIKYQDRITPTSAEFIVLNTPYNPMRFRGKLNLGWHLNAWGANARVNYASAYDNANDPSCSTPGCTVSAWTTMDLSGSYSKRGLRVSLDVANLFNRNPPFVYQQGGLYYDPTNANPLKRAVALTITRAWGDAH